MTRIKYRFLIALAVFCSDCNTTPEPGNRTETEISDSESAVLNNQQSVDKKIVNGNWTRTDSEYRIEILELYENGKIKAGYFNPDPINIGDTRWSANNGKLNIYIELKDINYPGSKYNLNYIPDKDILTGEYFQAVEGTTYQVAFARKK